MVAETIQMVYEAMQASLQASLYALELPNTPKVEQFLNPFSDDEVDPINYPAVVTNLASMRSPEAHFMVMDQLHAEIPVAVEFRTQAVDNSNARLDASMAQRGIIHVLNQITVNQPTKNNVNFIEIKDVVFDFVKFDGMYTGCAVLFTAIVRDLTDV